MIRTIAILIEILVLSALILVTRCANYESVFVAGNVYFTDADCYARMTRVRICAQHPGAIVRHHDFENVPEGTTPHTTAPMDYLILALAILLSGVSAHAIDLAGALVSPLLALFTGWFFWWWSKGMKFRYRWIGLVLFALSPILVHGTELGRPDHQSLLLFLCAIALCAEWRLQLNATRGWSLTSGAAWALALWVSLYEPLILLLLLLIWYALKDRKQFTAPARRIGWGALLLVLAIGFCFEQRIPGVFFSRPNSSLTSWARTIGELQSIHFADSIWFQWCGWILLAAPFLIALAWWKEKRSATIRRALPIFATLLVFCFALTLWQARWAYFFVLLLALVLPLLIEQFKSRALVWIAFIISLFPIFQYWDARIWPNESESARRGEVRLEAERWRALANQIRSAEVQPFLAPWWLSPPIAYWSGQPGVAGSSHESLPGIVDSARFCLTSEAAEAREILERHHVRWVFIYDSERTLETAAGILNAQIPAEPLGRVLDRTPSRAPNFLKLAAQNGTGKLYSVKYFP